MQQQAAIRLAATRLVESTSTCFQPEVRWHLQLGVGGLLQLAGASDGLADLLQLLRYVLVLKAPQLGLPGQKGDIRY